MYVYRAPQVPGITMIFTFPTGRQHISGSYKEMTVQEVDARLTITNTHTVYRTVFYLFSQDVKRNRFPIGLNKGTVA